MSEFFITYSSGEPYQTYGDNLIKQASEKFNNVIHYKSDDIKDFKLKNQHLWDYNKGDGVNLLDIQIYAQELATLCKREIGNKKIKIGGYSLGFRVAYHMALVFENRVEKLINIDGMLYKSKQEEEAINKIIIEENCHKSVK